MASALGTLQSAATASLDVFHGPPDDVEESDAAESARSLPDPFNPRDVSQSKGRELQPALLVNDYSSPSPNFSAHSHTCNKHGVYFKAPHPIIEVVPQFVTACTTPRDALDKCTHL